MPEAILRCSMLRSSMPRCGMTTDGNCRHIDQKCHVSEHSHTAARASRRWRKALTRGHGSCMLSVMAAMMPPTMEAQMVEKRKSNSVVTVARLPDGMLSFDVLGAGKITFDPAKAHPDMRAYAELHGWEQRLRDRAAIGRDGDTGASATPQDKFDAIKELADHYMSGAADWSMRGEGGGQASITLQAIAMVKGITYDQAEALVADFAAKKHGGDTKKALAFLRQGERVMRAMEEIRAKRIPAPKVDADEALNEIG